MEISCYVSGEDYLNLSRDCHGYRKTHRFEVTGFAGMGTVINFDTPWHTAYLCHGITGINGYITTECELFLLFFSHF